MCVQMHIMAMGLARGPYVNWQLRGKYASTPTLRSECADPIYARFESIVGENRNAYLQTTAEGSPTVTTDVSKVSRRSDCFPRLLLVDDRVER
jgi:hypothetical protein